jgi:DNA-directed RNA polymerase III subunit RPC2
VRRNDELIGKMPIMLGSSNCWLRGKSHEELAKMRECPYDPRGYFIIKGVEKVLLIQEQMSKNRIIVEYDSKKNLTASVISATHDTKSRTTIMFKNSKFYLKHNSFENEIPIFIIFKAMGIQSEQEIAQMIGTDQIYLERISLSMQECLQLNVDTQKEALTYVASRMKVLKYAKKSIMVEDTRTMLNKVILAHIQSPRGNLVPKCRYLALMIRRIVDAIQDPQKIDDKVIAYFML